MCISQIAAFLSMRQGHQVLIRLLSDTLRRFGVMAPVRRIFRLLIRRLEAIVYVAPIWPQIGNRLQPRDRDSTNNSRAGHEDLPLLQKVGGPAEFSLREDRALIPVSILNLLCAGQDNLAVFLGV